MQAGLRFFPFPSLYTVSLHDAWARVRGAGKARAEGGGAKRERNATTTLDKAETDEK